MFFKYSHNYFIIKLQYWTPWLLEPHVRFLLIVIIYCIKASCQNRPCSLCISPICSGHEKEWTISNMKLKADKSWFKRGRFFTFPATSSSTNRVFLQITKALIDKNLNEFFLKGIQRLWSLYFKTVITSASNLLLFWESKRYLTSIVSVFKAAIHQFKSSKPTSER